MELSVIHLIKSSYLIEFLSLFVATRIIWSQWLPVALAECKSSSLILFMARKNRIERSILKANIDGLSCSKSTDIRTVHLHELAKQNLIFQYNLVCNRSHVFAIFLAISCIGYALVVNPMMIGSLIIADSITTRIHQHFLSSFN